MTSSKRETLTVDRDALTRAFMSKDMQVNQDTLMRVADVMAEAAKTVLAAQGVSVRIKRSRGASGPLKAKGLQKQVAKPLEKPTALRGQGLPAPLSSEDGIAELRRRAVQVPIEQWAGEVLGPTKAAEALGIRRSTLDNWRTKGVIIALPKGKAAHVIPMAQFVEGRPVPGIDRVLQIAHGAASVAWSWLVTPHVDFDEKPPLDALSEGRKKEVSAAAERSIG